MHLGGFLWKPDGSGPFPTLLWNHGSERSPGWLPQLAPAFLNRGYVFFIPHRRGHGRSPGAYIGDQIQQARAGERGTLLVRLHEEQLGDQLAALEFLKAQSFIDSARVAVAGCSYGGIQTVLAAERGPGHRAAVAFAGAAQSWRPYPELQARMITAVCNARIPIFFIQAENDYDLTPSRVLAEEMQRAGKPHRVKIYPAFGSTNQDGHEFCVRGVSIWGTDVFPFLEANLK